MTESKLKLLLTDDQLLFAESLRTFLNNYAEDMTVIGIAKNGKEAVSMVGEYGPHIVLMDIRMPEMDGVEAVRIIKPKYPDIKIIMLSTYREDMLVRSALLAGASGYLLKDIFSHGTYRGDSGPEQRDYADITRNSPESRAGKVHSRAQASAS